VQEIDGLLAPLECSVNPGADLQDVDVIIDVPGIISVAVLKYANGAVYEMAVTSNAEPDDLALARFNIPAGTLWLGPEETNTHGLTDGWETTWRFWVANPPTE
jgi:hypothetical protein